MGRWTGEPAGPHGTNIERDLPALSRFVKILTSTGGNTETVGILTGGGRAATLAAILREVSDAAPVGEHLAPGFPRGLWPQSLGETLRLLRHRARISRDELAQRAGVSAGAISNYENDVSMPAALTLRRVCAALGMALGSPTADLWDEIGRLLDHVDEQPRSAL